MRYEANADLLVLEAAGVDLTGLYVVRRNVQLGQRRLAGRISHLAKDVVHLSEATDEETIATSAVRLEGSLETFSHCLRTLLGDRYGALHEVIDGLEANFRLGPAFDNIVERMGEFL